MNPKHTTIAKTEVLGEETLTIPVSLLIHTLTYHEELVGEKEEVKSTMLTSNDKLLADIISCVSDITKKRTKRLSIEIDTDDNYTPRLITKRIVLKNKSFKK